MSNPVKDIDELVKNLTSLKRAINKFNRNSPEVKVNIETRFNNDVYLYLNNITENDYLKLTDDENYILETDYTCGPYYDQNYKIVSIPYGSICNNICEDIILLLNKIFECLNHDAPKKDKFQEHMDLAHELVSEWPKWKQDILAHTKPAIYKSQDPQ